MSARDSQAGGAHVELLLKDEEFVTRLGKAQSLLAEFIATEVPKLQAVSKQLQEFTTRTIER